MIIGIAGYIGSGKDTIADYLVEKHGFERVSFASSLKDACANIFHWDREMLEGKTKEHREMREQVDTWWSERLGIPGFSPRFALQYIGTDVLRKHFDDSLWILSLERSILNNPDRKVVISDLRFPNEFKMIKELNGVTVDVVRGEEPEWASVAKLANGGVRSACEQMSTKFNYVHISEWARLGHISGYTIADVTIDNNGTLTDLYSAIETKILPLL